MECEERVQAPHGYSKFLVGQAVARKWLESEKASNAPDLVACGDNSYISRPDTEPGANNGPV